MKKTEVAKLFAMIKCSYLNFPADSQLMLDSWTKFLELIPYERAERNLLNHIQSNKYPPTPAEIIGERTNGPYIPNAEETRMMLDERDKVVGLPCPEQHKMNLPWYNKNRQLQ